VVINVEVPVAPISLIASIAKNRRRAGDKTEKSLEEPLTVESEWVLTGLIFSSGETRRMTPHAIIGNDHTR
jgi:hypothetical protein